MQQSSYARYVHVTKTQWYLVDLILASLSSEWNGAIKIHLLRSTKLWALISFLWLQHHQVWVVHTAYTALTSTAANLFSKIIHTSCIAANYPSALVSPGPRVWLSRIRCNSLQSQSGRLSWDCCAQLGWSKEQQLETAIKFASKMSHS